MQAVTVAEIDGEALYRAAEIWWACRNRKGETSGQLHMYRAEDVQPMRQQQAEQWCKANSIPMAY